MWTLSAYIGHDIERGEHIKDCIRILGFRLHIVLYSYRELNDEV
jgi:hypothetical protein